MTSKLGVVTQLSPLRVRVNGETADTTAEAADDFTSAVVGKEVLVETVENRRFARWVR